MAAPRRSELRDEAERLVQLADEDPVKGVFLRRAVRALGRMASEAPSAAMAAAAEASTDAEVLVRALEEPSSLELLTQDDVLAPAKLRGLRERDRLLTAEGGTWDAERVASHLHLTRQGVNRRRRAGVLLAIDVGRRGFRYPAWQFVRKGTLSGLERVLRALVGHDSWMQLAFVLGPNPRLNHTSPLDALRAGREDDVVAAAQALGEHGAA